MKYIYCKICSDLIQLRNKFKHCKCGNVCGKYLSDNSRVEVAFYYPDMGLIGGISNRFFMCDEPYVPQKDGGYFGRQESAITKIPHTDTDNNIIIKDWKTFFMTNDTFKLKFIYYNGMLSTIVKKVIHKHRKQYSRCISKGDEVDFISHISGKKYRIGILEDDSKYGTGYVNEIIDGESYTRNGGLVTTKPYYTTYEIFELQHIEHAWNGSKWIRDDDT